MAESHFCHFCHMLTPDTEWGACSRCYSSRVGTHDKRYCAFCTGLTEDDSRGNCAACGAPRYTQPEPPPPPPPPPPVGITFALDVSSYDTVDAQGKYTLACDWKNMRDVDGVSIAIIKSSEYVKDPGFALQWQAAAGILPRMFYHFFRPGANAQYKLIMDTVTDFRENDLAAVDFEYSDPNLSIKYQRDYAYSVLRDIQIDYDTVPYLYGGWWFLQSMGVLDDSRFEPFHWWLPQYPYDTSAYITTAHPTWTPAEIKSRFMDPIKAETLKPAYTFFGRKPDIWQFTGKAHPSCLSGYPTAAAKKVIDLNAVFVDVSH